MTSKVKVLGAEVVCYAPVAEAILITSPFKGESYRTLPEQNSMESPSVPAGITILCQENEEPRTSGILLRFT